MEIEFKVLLLQAIRENKFKVKETSRKDINRAFCEMRHCFHAPTIIVNYTASHGPIEVNLCPECWVKHLERVMDNAYSTWTVGEKS